jgi:acyl dehydratase
MPPDEPVLPVTLESPRSLAEFVGHEIGASAWLEVTQDRILQFAEATEDRQWIHLDRERAEHESPFGATVAHGFLTLSLAGYLMSGVLRFRQEPRMAVNYGLNRVRFPAPVRVGSNIRGRFTLQSLKTLPDCMEAVWAASIEVENSAKPCCVVEWVVRYYL